MENMDEHCIWSKDQYDILHVFMKAFNRRFKKDPESLMHQPISLSRDTTDLDNEWLPEEPVEEEMNRRLIKSVH